MKNLFVFLILLLLFVGIDLSANASADIKNNVNIIYTGTSAIAAPRVPDKKKPLMYPNAKNGYRTGFAKPKKRFAHLNKRFSKPQTRYAHKRPDYIYSKEYQKNIVNRHNPGMAKKNTAVIPPSVVKKNTNVNKVVACGGITYYGIQNNCK